MKYKGCWGRCYFPVILRTRELCVTCIHPCASTYCYVHAFHGTHVLCVVLCAFVITCACFLSLKNETYHQTAALASDYLSPEHGATPSGDSAQNPRGTITWSR